jgi:hypothetical protein
VLKADNLPLSSADVTESGSLNLSEPSGPYRAVMGLLYLLFTAPRHPQQKWKKTVDTCRYVQPVCLRYKHNDKEIPLQACTGPEGFRILKFPDL